MMDQGSVLHNLAVTAIGPSCYNPEPLLHLVIDLGESFYTAMFKTQVVTAPYTYDNTPGSAITIIPETAETDNLEDVARGNIKAWGEITVTGGTEVTEENLEILTELLPTEQTIVFNEASNPTEVSSIELIETKLELEIGTILPDEFVVENVPFCGNRPPVDLNYLNQFCNDPTKYYPIFQAQVPGPSDNNESFDEDSDMIITISPNPTSSFANLNIEIPQEGKITIKILNLMGQVVENYISEKVFLPGSHLIPLDLRGFTPGTYFVEIYNNEKKVVKRIVKN